MVLVLRHSTENLFNKEFGVLYASPSYLLDENEEILQARVCSVVNLELIWRLQFLEIASFLVKETLLFLLGRDKC